MIKTLNLSVFALALALPHLSFGQVFNSTEGTYVNSGTNGIVTNLSEENRTLIGFHKELSLLNMRGVYQFDLSSITETITSITLTLTQESYTTGDQTTGRFGLVLKNLGESFDDEAVTWSTLTPAGGDTSGDTLSTVAGYNASTISSATFISTVDFVAAANSAAGGSNLLSLMIYSPGAEADTGDRSFYRFNDFATLNITTVPEPSSYALLFAGACGLLVVSRRKRS